MNSNHPHIFIPSYHRADNLKTVRYFSRIGWDASHLHVVIDSEANDKVEYYSVCRSMGVRLHVFDMDEARRRYDYVHIPTPARRSAGQARNMFYDIAKSEGTTSYIVIDDDTEEYQTIGLDGVRRKNVSTIDDVLDAFLAVQDFCERRHIGLFGIPQCGDYIGGRFSRKKLFFWKVMNTTFINTKYIYRGERGMQDDDTSMFTTVMNEGYFTGSAAVGVVPNQTPSASSKGGLTDLYQEAKLLNKALTVPLQFPSAVYAELQRQNGGRVHHHIVKKYLMPCVIKNDGGRSNIAWDAYDEDVPFSNERRHGHEVRPVA